MQKIENGEWKMENEEQKQKNFRLTIFDFRMKNKGNVEWRMRNAENGEWKIENGGKYEGRFIDRPYISGGLTRRG